MDISSRIAARRAELNDQAEAEKEAAAALTRQQIADNIEERNMALDQVAAELSSPEVTVVREDDHLAIPTARLATLEGNEEMKTSAIEDLLKREARLAWTPGENWLIIGSIVGGICLIPVGFLGIILLLFGLWRRYAVNKKYREVLKQQHPKVFERITETTE